MAYTLPNFNLLADVYRLASPPPAGPPQYSGVTVQLYANSRMTYWDWSYMSIRTPKAPSRTYLVGDIWESPAGTARYWKAVYTERIHEGFPNEYWAIRAWRCNAAGALIGAGLP